MSIELGSTNWSTNIINDPTLDAEGYICSVVGIFVVTCTHNSALYSKD